MDTRPDFLTPIAGELVVTISDFDDSVCINLPPTSRRFYNFFNEPKRIKALGTLRQLLCHAATGDWDIAKDIWERSPGLLTCRGTVNHEGRYKYVDCSPLEIALMNEEWEVVNAMGNKVPAEEMQAAYAKVFPDGQIIKHNWELEHARSLLRVLFDAVVSDRSIDLHHLDRMNEATQAAYKALFDYMRPTPEHRTGLVCDTNVFIAAQELFDNVDMYGEFQNNEQRSFWCIRVEEGLAALLGTRDLRHHAWGILNDRPLNHMSCLLGDESPYFASRRAAPDSVPGLHIRVNVYGSGCVGAAAARRACECVDCGGRGWRRAFQNL